MKPTTEGSVDMKGSEDMYETKALLSGQLDYALAMKNKVMYNYVLRQLCIEGITLPQYSEALKEFEENNNPDA